MANTAKKQKTKQDASRPHGSRRHQRRQRSRRRPRRAARRATQTRRSRAARRGMRAAQRNLGQARSDMRRFGTNVRQAGEKVMQAGEAAARGAAELASEGIEQATGVARRRIGDAAERAGDRLGEAAIEAGRTAVGLGAQIFHLPELVREGARLGVEAVETAGTRAVVSMIHAGTKALNVAADYVSEIAPRRRVQRRALEELIIEMLGWAHAGTEAYDWTASGTEDQGLRVRLVRYKLQTIRHGETLTLLLREIGGSVPSEERGTPPPVVGRRDGARGPAAVRQGIAHALTVAVQSAEGWKALERIATWAEPDRIGQAIVRAGEAVGHELQEQLDFLRETLLDETVEAVLA
jgi:hypothetical protein